MLKLLQAANKEVMKESIGGEKTVVLGKLGVSCASTNLHFYFRDSLIHFVLVINLDKYYYYQQDRLAVGLQIGIYCNMLGVNRYKSRGVVILLQASEQKIWSSKL